MHYSKCKISLYTYYTHYISINRLLIRYDELFSGHVLKFCEILCLKNKYVPII